MAAKKKPAKGTGGVSKKRASMALSGNTRTKKLTQKVIDDAVHTATHLCQDIHFSAYRTNSGTAILFMSDKEFHKNALSKTASVISVSSTRPRIEIKKKVFEKYSADGKIFWLIWAMIRRCFGSGGGRACDCKALEITLNKFPYLNCKKLGLDIAELFARNPTAENVARVQNLTDKLKEYRESKWPKSETEK